MHPLDFLSESYKKLNTNSCRLCPHYGKDIKRFCVKTPKIKVKSAAFVPPKCGETIFEGACEIWEIVTSFLGGRFICYTANMCREITVKVHLKNCNFEKLQFFTVDHSSLCFLPVKNCNFSIIFNVVYFALN